MSAFSASFLGDAEAALDFLIGLVAFRLDDTLGFQITVTLEASLRVALAPQQSRISLRFYIWLFDHGNRVIDHDRG